MCISCVCVCVCVCACVCVCVCPLGTRYKGNNRMREYIFRRIAYNNIIGVTNNLGYYFKTSLASNVSEGKSTNKQDDSRYIMHIFFAIKKIHIFS